MKEIKEAVNRVTKEYGPVLQALGSDMTEEQNIHMLENVDSFKEAYVPKYINGQKRHSGNMWQMGAYQALENMEAEVLDQWSYCRQIRKCLDEIEKAAVAEEADIVLHILNREKDDNYLPEIEPQSVDEKINYEVVE